jgi:hypothetical protein
MSGATAVLSDFAGRIDRYADLLDYPCVKAPSGLSVHLRFGTLFIRAAARLAHDAQRCRASPGAATWLYELVWRDFYFMILHHHPCVVEHAFKPEYDRIAWETGPEVDERFQAWCAGRTGYPPVDAAMAQLNRTGYMHNRLMMVSASFLAKDLGIDWPDATTRHRSCSTISSASARLNGTPSSSPNEKPAHEARAAERAKEWRHATGVSFLTKPAIRFSNTSSWYGLPRYSLTPSSSA